MELSKLLSGLNEEEIEKLLREILTDKKYDYANEFCVIAELILQGVTHREIKRRRGVSITLITRVSRKLQYGGIRDILKKAKNLPSAP